MAGGQPSCVPTHTTCSLWFKLLLHGPHTVSWVLLETVGVGVLPSPGSRYCCAPCPCPLGRRPLLCKLSQAPPGPLHRHHRHHPFFTSNLLTGLGRWRQVLRMADGYVWDQGPAWGHRVQEKVLSGNPSLSLQFCTALAPAPHKNRG